MQVSSVLVSTAVTSPASPWGLAVEGMGVDGPAEQKPVCSVRYGPMQTAATATTVFSHKLRNPPTPKFGGFLPSEIWGFLQFGLSVQGRLQAFLSWSPEPVLDHATPPLPSPPFVLQCAVRRPRYGAATVPSAETRPGGGTSPTRAAGSKAWSNQYFHPHETSRHRSKRVLHASVAHCASRFVDSWPDVQRGTDWGNVANGRRRNACASTRLWHRRGAAADSNTCRACGFRTCTCSHRGVRREEAARRETTSHAVERGPERGRSRLSPLPASKQAEPAGDRETLYGTFNKPYVMLLTNGA